MDGTSMAIRLILALEIFSLGITIVLARISAARIQMEMDKLGNRVVEALAQTVEGLPIDGEAFDRNLDPIDGHPEFEHGHCRSATQEPGRKICVG